MQEINNYKKHYYIHETPDPNSVIEFDGYAREVVKEYGVSYANLDYTARGSRTHVLNGKHYVEYVKEPRLKPKNSKPYYRSPFNEARLAEGATGEKAESLAAKRKMSKFERKLDMIKRHLDIYGNTFTNKDPKKYLDALKERYGYIVDAEYRPCRTVIYKGVGAEEFDEIYILTLISKPREEKKNGTK